MADLSRIRNALDKSINLGSVQSGTMAIDPNGAYILRLANSSIIIEVEIIGGRLISIKNFTLTGSNITKINFAISTKNFLFFSVIPDANNQSNNLISSNLSLNIFVEYNLNPVAVYTNTTGIDRGSIPSEIRTQFDTNRTYYLEDVHFEGTTNEINATDISVDTLNINNFKTSLSEIQVAADAAIKVPKLVVQTVGIQQMDVDVVTAKDIATRTIILSNGNNRGWVFSADPNVSGDSNIIILRANVD